MRSRAPTIAVVACVAAAVASAGSSAPTTEAGRTPLAIATVRVG
jgi:hypothetical protein